jgi:hypothetical protein
MRMETVIAVKCNKLTGCDAVWNARYEPRLHKNLLPASWRR